MIGFIFLIMAFILLIFTYYRRKRLIYEVSKLKDDAKDIIFQCSSAVRNEFSIDVQIQRFIHI